MALLHKYAETYGNVLQKDKSEILQINSTETIQHTAKM